MSVSKRDVQDFLNEFRVKLETFNVFIERERSKNLQTILDLELSNITIREHLKKLFPEDYYRGPTIDVNGGPDLWEFGKEIKGSEVYIKITLGLENKPVICISFHYPEHDIIYPFK